MTDKAIKISEVEKILFYLFLFLIPFQIRMTISWQGSEWDSVFLYLTDLLLIGFLFFGFINKRISFKKTDILLFLFLIIAGISLFASSDLGISVYRFIKLLEFVLLYIYIKNNPEKFWRSAKINGASVLIASGVFQSILAIAQFYKQGSLGLKFIEAGIYAPGAPGVATFLMGDDKIMRAYGSFPHPNVLAGFLLLTIFCLYQLSIGNSKSQILNPKQIQNPKPNPQNLFYVICYMLCVFALFLTFSRGPILVFLIMSLVMFLFYLFRLRNLRRLNLLREVQPLKIKVFKLFGFFLISCLISVAILSPYLKSRFLTVSLQEEAIDLRFFYNKIALAIIKDKPLLGIGIGNFVNYSHNYPAFLRAAEKMLNLGGAKGIQGEIEGIPEWLYQPVHNIYLLIGSEIGLIGLLAFLIFVIVNIWRSNLLREVRPLTLLFIGFLILGLSDHYFWTLQSGGLMLWTALALLEIGCSENGN